MDQFETIVINNILSPELALTAYFIDMIFGEFRIKHPISFIGDYIHWFEKRFYSNSILKGGLLVINLILITLFITLILLFILSFLPDYFSLILLAIIASTGIAAKMLYDSVKNILVCPNPRKELSLLVSRDTETMTESDVYKGAIETYAENLSDGVLAPLLFLIIFGVIGLYVYKVINTLDSMIGYRTERYERFGKIAARLDDIFNYIPSRITAFIIVIVSFSWKGLITMIRFGSKHTSPNAAYPISAMAGVLGIALGGPTFYQKELKEKPYFGTGRKIVIKEDLVKALKIRIRINCFVMSGLAFWILLKCL